MFSNFDRSHSKFTKGGYHTNMYDAILSWTATSAPRARGCQSIVEEATFVSAACLECKFILFIESSL